MEKVAEIENKKIDIIYAYFAIQFGREHFRRLQRGVRQKNLNLDLIKQIKIPLPSNDFQAKFLEIYKNIFGQNSFTDNLFYFNCIYNEF